MRMMLKATPLRTCPRQVALLLLCYVIVASVLDVASLVTDNFAGQFASILSARMYHTADVYGKLRGGLVQFKVYEPITDGPPV